MSQPAALTELEEIIRQRAHAIWEAEGKPEGKAIEHWQRAQVEIAAERATKVREAGPEAMESPPKDWSKIDEEVDQSFPASDPPGNY
jgi:hypothetical protein